MCLHVIWVLSQDDHTLQSAAGCRPQQAGQGGERETQAGGLGLSQTQACGRAGGYSVDKGHRHARSGGLSPTAAAVLPPISGAVQHCTAAPASPALPALPLTAAPAHHTASCTASCTAPCTAAVLHPPGMYFSVPSSARSPTDSSTGVVCVWKPVTVLGRPACATVSTAVPTRTGAATMAPSSSTAAGEGGQVRLSESEKGLVLEQGHAGPKATGWQKTEDVRYIGSEQQGRAACAFLRA